MKDISKFLAVYVAIMLMVVTAASTEMAFAQDNDVVEAEEVTTYTEIETLVTPAPVADDATESDPEEEQILPDFDETPEPEVEETPVPVIQEATPTPEAAFVTPTPPTNDEIVIDETMIEEEEEAAKEEAEGEDDGFSGLWGLLGLIGLAGLLGKKRKEEVVAPKHTLDKNPNVSTPPTGTPASTTIINRDKPRV